MLYALDSIGERRQPVGKGERAKCPVCGNEVIGKVGRLVVRHWAHKSVCDCDSWSEGETAWHRDWKNCVPKEQQEVVIGPHRADIRLPFGTVVELQHSPISVDIVEERENFYGNMVWLFDGRRISVSRPDDPRSCHCIWESNDFGTSKTHTCSRCLDFLQIRQSKYGSGVFISEWKYRRKSWLAAQRPLFIHLGPDVLEIIKPARPGWSGRLISVECFSDMLRSGKIR